MMMCVLMKALLLHVGRQPCAHTPAAPSAHAGDLPVGQLIVQNDSTTAALLHFASLPSLWLHKLGVHVSAQLLGDDDKAARATARCSIMAVFRTCTACRDAVILSRPATAHAPVPIRPQHWPVVLQSLCTVLRRSRKVRLLVEGCLFDTLDWTETEPYIIHLLLCVRTKLGAAALEGLQTVALQVSGHRARTLNTPAPRTRCPIQRNPTANDCLLTRPW